MRIIFAGGGTAGHINPALAVAGYIREKEPQTEILYVGTKNGMEERLVAQAGLAFAGIIISGFCRKISLAGIKKNILTVKRIFSASQEAKKIIKEFKPDICVGTGGYVSGPVLRVAAKMGIPVIIHEQNAYPGVTNKMLARRAKKVMLAVEAARAHFPAKCDIAVTGNPVREELLTISKKQARAKLRLDERPVILSFGGSLGARKINEAVLELIQCSAKMGEYQHIHAYGQYGRWFPEKLSEKGISLKNHRELDVREYINDMPVCLAAADLVICRAGAITLSELQSTGKAAILIPSPNVAENHQYHNAMALVKNNAAAIIEEKDLTGKTLIQQVQRILGDEKALRTYEENVRKMAITDSNERIYKIIKHVLNA